ncbi:transcription antitermination factor NusB [Effusibacillus consociatus]|uniref:Transcription antitermination protein NusB n=1 Tax=Effusibacillus consociatus TaxID=1117041 RepID=A0ABV9Q5K8_9BACL
MSRRQVRESALQSLFQMNVGQVPANEAIGHVLEETNQEIDKEYLEKMVTGTHNNQSRIDSIIEKYSVGWKIDRMPTVDLTILRMAVYELLYEPGTPEKAIINEAIELAKAFSTAESGKFVNGILGKLVQDLDQLRGSVQE